MRLSFTKTPRQHLRIFIWKRFLFDAFLPPVYTENDRNVLIFPY